MGPESDLPGLPGVNTAEMDCQMSPQRCAAIQAGIDFLKAHANADCRALGSAAQDRFDAPNGMGYRDYQQIGGFDMSVFTNPRDGYTNVHPQFWNGPFSGQSAATGALVGHEEVHHSGGDETAAQHAQDTCLNPQP